MIDSYVLLSKKNVSDLVWIWSWNLPYATMKFTTALQFERSHGSYNEINCKENHCILWRSVFCSSRSLQFCYYKDDPLDLKELKPKN